MKLEDLMTQDQIEEAAKRVETVPREVFVKVADQLRRATNTMESAALETDGRKRLDLLFEMNQQMVELASVLGMMGA
jgi:hypothetical protein